MLLNAAWCNWNSAFISPWGCYFADILKGVACEGLLIKSWLSAFSVPKHMQPVLVLPTSCTAKAVKSKVQIKKMFLILPQNLLVVTAIFYQLHSCGCVLTFKPHPQWKAGRKKQTLCIVANFCLQFSFKILFAFKKNKQKTGKLHHFYWF